MNKAQRALKKLSAMMIGALAAGYSLPASAVEPEGWKDLGGYVTAPPAAASWAPGRIDTFVLGSDNTLYTKTFSEGVGWGEWASLGAPSDGPLTSAPTAASFAAGRLDVFARGANNALKHIWYDSSSGAWSTWEDLGGILTSAPAAVSIRRGRIDVFVVGGAGNLFTKNWDANRATWSEWAGLGGSPQSGGWQFDPAVAKSPDGAGIDVFLVAPDGTLQSNYYAVDAGPAWSNTSWFSWGGHVEATPAVASWSGHTEVLVVGGSGADHPLFQRSWDSATGLSEYRSLGGNWPIAPAAASAWPGKVDYLAVSPTTNTLKHLAQSDWAESLARAYAPQVQLHPDERFMPSSIEYANPYLTVQCDGVTVAESLLEAPSSVLSRSDCFWTTRQPIPFYAPYTELPHFSGQNPAQTQVPIYVSMYGIDADSFVAEYKMFYPYNYGKMACIGLAPFDECIGDRVLIDNHVGDWEGMSIKFTRGVPSAVFVGAHNSDNVGHAYAGAELAQLAMAGTHPIVYSAEGSHGIWGHAGAHLYDIIGSWDHLVDNTATGGVSWHTWDKMQVVAVDGVSRPGSSWFSYKSRWGNHHAGLSTAQLSMGIGPSDEYQLNPGPPAPAFDRDRTKMTAKVINDWGYDDKRWVVDFNGDGKADLCRAAGNNNGDLLVCAFSTGTGLSPDMYFPVADWGYAGRRWMADFNGDGKADLCRAVGNNNGDLLACMFSTGTGLTGDHYFPVADWGYDGRRWMVDFNGDGKADLCRAVGNNGDLLACSLSTGAGLAGEYSVLAPLADWGYDDFREMADVNGDGKADFCRAVGTKKEFLGCSFSTGSGLAGEYSTLLPVSDWGKAEERWLADIDGDRRADFVHINWTMRNLLEDLSYHQ
jgi:hypothetical protein